ncbi:LacI family DNA-binding transcriptional regulator [Pollutimonas harenae]|uniref:LacI family DNA-binding transcriptional regulator n=1 Tax=Pollutimonas harenae TaxID=657015 RepID=A0A853H3A6_9BURK|nr:LacI family DNA-binding transcriptional regulator [Pollutimonas harenae]NYT86510.1 LacI family DNA-binding transcriptional regulator [Pollutimonas harenae]TEA69746.1 LacI family DNA-binding transcriptional regulator [Pollutimonas harenae]
MTKNVRRSTIADVARQAGVSKATVSRFLNHRDTLLSPEIARRVEAAIAQLGYSPSPMAQALKRGRSRLIGLVVADITNPFSVAVLRGAEQACREAGYLVMLFNMGNEGDRESAGLQALSSYKVEGFILNTTGHDPGAALEAARQGKPIVLVDRRHEGLNVDFVSLDNQHAIALSCRHLLGAGYRELMLITEPLDKVSARIERKQAFHDFVQTHADEVSGCDVEAQDQTGLIEALKALRGRAAVATTGCPGGGVPAVIAANAVVTLRVIEAVAQLGWRLGHEIGLLGIDDTPWAPYIGPGISTVAQPTTELGRLTAHCLIQRLQGLDGPARQMLLKGKLMVRGSTRTGRGAEPA